jgi:hypothetical protein
MTRLFFLFNHTPTAAQYADARRTLGVEHFIEPPEHIQSLWRQVPPEPGCIAEYLAPVNEWLTEQARPGDFLLIQGDFGATYLMVNFALENGLVPIYSTTERQALERHGPDGSVQLSHTFRHCRFRRYGE